ncbi:ceramidase domain-containing protein [Fibrella forsythiae]|uniref:Ceramidase domain-containing protein n=1 Tax=Fibrella forsythiae TaxID=2817061 RepID=A0ABS3JKJ8_9BACT|nr:ceramidase domain-containing protein [Fibrella forsythiae]MBO0950520.1 ceramidase domain-containing protein [Fibrella forsythiae]
MTYQLLVRLAIRSFLLTLGMLAVWWGLDSFFNGSVWEGMVISKSALVVEYCEFNNVARFFHQRMNTYSNLAYFFFGVLILQIAYDDYKNEGIRRQNRLESFPMLSALMGICFIYLGFGSAFFHASLTWIGQRVDMNGTYGITLVLVSIGFYHVLHKIRFTPLAKSIWAGLLVVLIVLFLEIALLIPSSRLLPGLILALLAFIAINYIQFRKKRSGLLAIASLVLMVVAVRFRTLDVQKVGCDPHSLIQGHSIWHLLTALSSVCSYSFFRFTK